jgi:uncharacterized RDD family membrane protein YckC
MNNFPQRKLQELVNQYGQTLWENPNQLENILNHSCRQYQREISILMAAVRERIPHDLHLNSRNSVPERVLCDRLAKRLQDNCGLETSAAQWAVETWALSLGIVAAAAAPSTTSTLEPSAQHNHSLRSGSFSNYRPSASLRRFRYPKFGTRFLAYVLDSVILSIIQIISVFLLIVMFDIQDELSISLVNFATLIMLSWLYYTLQESSDKQATIGKQAFKIIVTDMNGDRISFGRATGRYFAKLPSGLSIVGYFLAANTEKKQALHDSLSACLVRLK